MDKKIVKSTTDKQAGKEAEEKFIEIANLNGWIVEKIPQDQESFWQYRKISKKSKYTVKN